MAQGFRHGDPHGYFVEPSLEFTRDWVAHLATNHLHADEQRMSGAKSPPDKLKSVRKLPLNLAKPTPLSIIEMPPGHEHSNAGAA